METKPNVTTFAMLTVSVLALIIEVLFGVSVLAEAVLQTEVSEPQSWKLLGA